ncbi:5-formyltetrahydrofolate cyclo-ligase [Flavisolibacter ginsenosidimutans]|uniref:5-formyltetrahydrofolate cyclo-ligase n=1 Tax=Flavisolibacter ginsenosidimutans TaxID=661481 RepID=A0A5B8UG46_9BACT|nr:5-formyltetrahydrofolate cyclo-ligase [Flavisolibacter ginsenosidimutans]QEC55382.1 5-formyltetrahydrofolate cyclo-ligase [Flavisolibacter ginsenosidimutans]
MLKKEARKIYNKKREGISYADKLKWDDLILINFQTIEMPFLQTVFSFYPMEERNEINAFLITDYLHFRNLSLQICYPKMDIKEPNMEAVACKADTVFEANALNILEPLEAEIINPEDIDLVLAPMLVCDVQGNRVGYGKGYYDRYLNRCNPSCIKVGLSYFEPVGKIEDADEFDVALDFCITPQKAYVF